MGQGSNFIALSFMLECWYTRNNSEHDNKGDKVGRAKEKFAEEILWLIEKSHVKAPPQTKETLTELPQENLK
jgi:hypothetical protein